MLVVALAAVSALNCSDLSALDGAYRAAVTAYQAERLEEARSILDSMIAACPRAPGMSAPRTLRADIALRQKDFDAALAALDGVERPLASGLGPYPSFIALRALSAKKDSAAYAAEARRLTDAVEARLVDPNGAVKAKVLERFSVGTSEVTALEGEYRTGPFVRKITFLIRSSEPFRPVETIMLSQDPAVDVMSAQMKTSPVYFIDEYTCERHVTVAIIPQDKADYAAARARVVTWLGGEKTSASSSEAPGACGFAAFVAPGWTAE